MLNKPRNIQINAYASLTEYAKLVEETHGILSVTTNGEDVVFTICDNSANENIVPLTVYTAASKDRRSGFTASKFDTFPPKDAERGNHLSYKTTVGASRESLRITGQVINVNTNSLLFTFNAHTNERGWDVTVDDYVDHGTLDSII